MIFEVFEDVLAELDSQGRALSGSVWEQDVDSRLQALAAYYGNQNLRNADRTLIDYSGIPTQAAYVFMYAIGRADFTYQILKRFRQLHGKPLFSNGDLNITSIGGGPASELVGLVKYLDEDENGEDISQIIYDVMDKEGDWKNVFELVVELLPTEISIIPQFYTLDIADAAAISRASLKHDDLVIMSFFISEICALPNKQVVCKNLETLLSTMKNGARLFSNDSDAYSFYSFMNGRAQSVKGLTEEQEIQELIVCDFSNPGATYEEYAETFDKLPHLNSRAVSKLYRREV